MRVTHPLRTLLQRERGFALVVTLALMILLVVIALGLLSLSTISIRSSQQGQQMAEARANARLAMMLAIGELQSHLGPDARTSVPAEALTNVLSSVQTDWAGATAVLSAPDPTLTDPKDRLKKSFRSWLVSGDPQNTKNLNLAESAMPGGGLNLYPKASSADGSVRASAVNVSGQQAGRYSWWVEDLGTKASLALRRQEDDSLRLLAPDRFGAKAVTGFEGAPKNDAAEWDRVVSVGTAELLAAPKAETRTSTRSLTALHRGVLADMANGQLKRDLTAAWDSDESTANRLLGSQIYEPMAKNKRDPGGPRWELLRQYYKSGTSGALTVRPQTAKQPGCFPIIAGLVEMYGASNTFGYAPSATPHPSFPPNYYSDKHVVTMHMSPVVKLWNPYDKPLQALQGFTVAVANGDYQHTTVGGDGSYQDLITWTRGGSGIVPACLPKSIRFEHRYRIPPVTFAPGETKVFGLSANRFLDLEGTYVPFDGRSVGAKTNVVQSGWILGELSEITSGGFTGASFWDLMLTKRDIPVADRSILKWGGGRANGGYGGADQGDIQIHDTVRPTGTGFKLTPHPFATWSIRLFEGEAKLPKQGSPDPRIPLISIRNVNTKTSGYKKDNTYLSQNPDPTSHLFFMDPSGQDSIWARRFVLKQVLNDGDNDLALYNPTAAQTKDAKWLANFNPRSPTIGCWPYDNRKPAVDPNFTGSTNQISVNGRTNSSGGGVLGTPGNYLSGMVEELTTRDALFLNSFVGYSDFAGPDKCILFQTLAPGNPEKLFHSIGQLRHASLWIENGDYTAQTARGHTDEDWFADNMQPAWPIGNSYADPRMLPSENRGLFRTLTVRDERTTYESTQHDLSFFLNQSLWDSYFFSAKRPTVGESYNSRLSSLGSKLEDGENGFNRNAAKLMLDGAFNINSMDVDAWAAFFSSLCDTTVGGIQTSNAAYPRVTTNPTGEVTNKTGADHTSQYTGFRGVEADEVRTLAEKVVEEIKSRGPAATLAAFVNRSDATGSPTEQRIKGALQAAIDKTDINKQLRGDGNKFQIPTAKVPTAYDRDAFAGDIAAGVPGYLTQGDIMERLGHLMSARSDTFVVRARGESLDKNGKVLATAICEATVQRMPDYVDPTVDPWTKAKDLVTDSPSARFGRAFKITGFRWLSISETTKL